MAVTISEKRFQELLFAAGSALTALLVLGTVVYQQFSEYPVVIASSPSGAHIRVGDRDVGDTPVTLALERGTHIVEAARAGYETAQQAIYVPSREGNAVNIQLRPAIERAPPDTMSEGTANTALVDLVTEVERLKSALLLKPEEAVSVLLIRERLKVQEEITQALRDELRGVKDQAKWYIGSIILTIVSLLGVIATLFSSLRSKR